MKFLDLDAIVKEADYTLKLKGKEHPMKVATVQTFIDNTKELEKLATNGSVVEEIEVALGMICRAFPTLTREDVTDLTLQQMQTIVNYAQEAGGEKAQTKEDAAENPPVAS